jgi:hypothetical protein
MRSTPLVAVLVLLGTAGAASASGQHVAIAWNDFDAGTGFLGAISASNPWSVSRAPISVGLDSVLHSAFGKLYVVSPGDRTVRVVDPRWWTVERSIVLAPGDDPLDIKVVSPELAYVTRGGARQLLEVDLAAGTTREGVDLSVLADADGVPDQGTMAVHDGRLFIQLRRVNFDDPAPFPQPFVAVVDLASNQLVDVDPGRAGLQAIELDGTFPKMKMQVVEQTGKLLVSATGGFFDDGGIESRSSTWTACEVKVSRSARMTTSRAPISARLSWSARKTAFSSTPPTCCFPPTCTSSLSRVASIPRSWRSRSITSHPPSNFTTRQTRCSFRSAGALRTGCSPLTPRPGRG